MKHVISILLLIFCGNTLQAQNNGGLKLGLNLANISAEYNGEKENSDMFTGILVGGYLNYSISDKLVFQPELLYSKLGGKQSEYDPDLQMNVNVVFKFDYISLPLNLKYKVTDDFSLLAGAQVGLLVGAKTGIDFFGTSFSVDSKDQFKSLDFGLNVGASYSIKKFTLDARYTLGLSNIADFEETDIQDVSFKNRAISFSVGYRILE